MVRVPLADSTLVPVPGDLTPLQALLCGDVLATGYFGAQAAGVGKGATVAVVGCGPVGLLAARAALHLGAAEVYAVDSIRERLELAARFGARALELAQGPVEVLRQVTDGRGADAAIEAVGSASATRLAVDLVRPGGAICAVGVHTESSLAFTPGEAYDKNLTYRAGRCPVRAYLPQVLEWVRSDSMDLASIVSHRLPLEEGVFAYEIFAEKREGCIKVVLEP
jgi:threonine dehydrogenase-like Zn-dependent dehydrogenase